MTPRNIHEVEMSEINILPSEQAALWAIDSPTFSRHIDQCVGDGHASALAPYRLHSCGLYFGSNLRRFERALLDYRQSKSARKLETTRTDALRAGSDLLFAVEEMKTRVEIEAKQAERFYIEDHIRPPFKCTDQLSVAVHYRWRPDAESEWVYASIEFLHRFDPHFNLLHIQPARKRSASQQARDRQDRLDAEWEQLKRHALWSVRDYLQDGGDGALIPKTFRVKADTHTGGLNNFSAKFWQQPAESVLPATSR
ncbi:hypothetical protein EEB15_16275 [Ramlibacter sp. WS9]|nr:hypothetical protein EEB15_16275 [Ramlibacter sp. WS9]